MIATTLVFLAILSILVLVHEFGHFIVGRMAGIGVLEFALGLPFTKPLWSKKLKSGTKISLYPILFGGFVKLLGEEGKEKKTISGKHFYKANVWQRIAVVIAGVTMNFLFAVAVFYLFLSLSGFKILVPKLDDYHFLSPTNNVVIVTGVAPESPAQNVNLKFGDLIYSANGQTFPDLPSFQKFVSAHVGEKVRFKINDKIFEIVPRSNPPVGQGSLGIGINAAAELNFTTPMQKTFSGLIYTTDMLFYSISVLSGLIGKAFQTGDVAPVATSVSGPIGIATLVGDILAVGGKEAVLGIINLMGILSISLAFMNILPFPALDGGRLMFLLVEAVFGKKIAAKKENLVNQVGMALLLGFIILVSFNDLKRVFGK